MNSLFTSFNSLYTLCDDGTLINNSISDSSYPSPLRVLPFDQLSLTSYAERRKTISETVTLRTESNSNTTKPKGRNGTTLSKINLRNRCSNAFQDDLRASKIKTRIHKN